MRPRPGRMAGVFIYRTVRPGFVADRWHSRADLSQGLLNTSILRAIRPRGMALAEWESP